MCGQMLAAEAAISIREWVTRSMVTVSATSWADAERSCGERQQQDSVLERSRDSDVGTGVREARAGVAEPERADGGRGISSGAEVCREGRHRLVPLTQPRERSDKRKSGELRTRFGLGCALQQVDRVATQESMPTRRRRRVVDARLGEDLEAGLPARPDRVVLVTHVEPWLPAQPYGVSQLLSGVRESALDQGFDRIGRGEGVAGSVPLALRCL